jgi:hypothetical protein
MLWLTFGTNDHLLPTLIMPKGKRASPFFAGSFLEWYILYSQRYAYKVPAKDLLIQYANIIQSEPRRLASLQSLPKHSRQS